MVNKTFWNIWTTYATYYFGKVNYSIVMPILLATYGFTKYDLGLVASGFFFSYAIGQFLHGQISERFHPFTYIAVGLIGSAVMNFFLGWLGAFFWILLICEMIDGGFQSMGWSSCVRANAMTSKETEKSSCLLGTSYQVGNSVAWLASAFVVGTFGWQYGFWLASAVMMVRGIALYATRPKMKIKPNPVKQQLKFTLSFPIVISGLALCLLNIVRYGVIVWIPTYLFEVQGQDIFMVGLKVCLIPIAGVVGTLIYNRVKVNRELLTAGYLVLLGVMFMVLPGTTGLWTVALLLMSGFLVYGPHVFLVATMPSRFLDKKVVSASTGFIDGMAYVGAIIVGIVVPLLIDFGGWTLVFQFWAVIAFVVCALTLVLHKKRLYT